MPVTYEILTSQTISTGVSSISLNSISAAYTDLRLVLTSRVSAGSNAPNFRFNDDTGNNYSRIISTSTGNALAGSTVYNQTSIGFQFAADSGNSAFSITTLDIMSYSRTNHKKGMLLQQSSGTPTSSTPNTVRGMALWNQTSAISSIQITTGATWNVGTVVALYGISKA